MSVGKFRDIALTGRSGRSAGVKEAVTSTKCNLKTLPTRSSGDVVEKRYNQNAVRMYLQLWIATNQCRDTTSMILDPINWDNVPEPYDTSIPKIGDRPTIIKQDVFTIDDL